MASFIAVLVGGALGSGLRYGVSVLVRPAADNAIPVATLLVNVVGSFLLAFLVFRFSNDARFTPSARLFLTTGFCGGFTTYSTFNLELLSMVQRALYARSALYFTLTVSACFLGGVVGMLIAQRLLGTSLGASS